MNDISLDRSSTQNARADDARQDYARQDHARQDYAREDYAGKDHAREDNPSRHGTEDAARGGRDIMDLSRPDDTDRDDNGEKASARGDGGGGPANHKNQKKDADQQKDEPKPPSKKIFVLAALILIAALAWGGYAHWSTYAASRQTSSDTLDRPMEVRTIAAKRLDGPIALTLPGQTDAFDMANIYPRATGYISERRVDIGSRVKKGDLLVRIKAPDLDQQLAQAEAQIGQTRAAEIQAEAQVAQAVANVNLAKATFARTSQLTQKGYETQQNQDNQQANLQSQLANVEAAKAGVGVAQANIKAQQAAIDRLKALGAFEDVRAPFDGVVTSRSVDTGDLLNADSSATTPMFTIARDDVIRVTVRVPQSDAIGVKTGVEADVTVAQMPGRTFRGSVTRSSDALLYSSRTLTAEIDIANSDGALRSGLYVLTTLHIPRQKPDVNVPAEALIFNQNGMQVATVANQQAALQTITIARDHGTSVDVADGLKGGERIILNPPPLLTNGTKIKEQKEEDQKKPNDQAPKTSG